MSAYISLMSLYMYNDHLFDDLQLPDGVVKEVVVSEILAATAELEVIYPDYDVMKQMLYIYSNTRLNAWTRTFKALTAEYNPVWNKDGTIEESTRTDNTGRSDSTTNGQIDGYVTAFNDDAPKQNSRDINSTSGTFTSEAQGNQTMTRREYGNIGVTKSSELVRDEVVLRASYDITHIIAADIKRRFCLMVY